MKVPLFSLVLTQTPPGPTTVVPKRPDQATNDDMLSLVYSGLELIRSASDLRQEADNNLNLPQRRYKKEYDRHDRFDHMSQADHYGFLDMPPVSQFAAERSTTEVYNKLLLRKQGPWSVICV